MPTPKTPTQIPKILPLARPIDGLPGFMGQGRKVYTPRDPVPPLHVPITGR